MQTSNVVAVDFKLYSFAKNLLDKAVNAFYYFEDDFVEDIIDEAILRFDFQLNEDEETSTRKRASAVEWIWSNLKIRSKICKEADGIRAKK